MSNFNIGDKVIHCRGLARVEGEVNMIATAGPMAGKVRIRTRAAGNVWFLESELEHAPPPQPEK